MGRLFTSESVTEGHPDKIADSISDAILDALLTQDPASRVAVETLVTTGLVVVAGEVTTTGFADVAPIARQRILDIGYNSSRVGFDGASCGVSVALGAQSPDIAAGVDRAYEARVENDIDLISAQGAGDQGLMFGYACNETPSLMPLPIDMAHRMAERLTEVRKDSVLDYLRPDGKTQVTIVYDEHGRAAGSRLEKKEASAIAPSMTYNGSEAPKFPRPLKLIEGVCPGLFIIVTPGEVP